MASPAFDSLFARHAMSSYAKQLAFQEFVEESAWEVDLQAGSLSFSNGKSVRAGLLGSYGAAAGTWLWAWANTSMSELPPEATETAEAMRALGSVKSVPELETAEFEADDDLCHRIAMIAVGESEAGAYCLGPYEGGAAYLIVRDPIPLPADRHRLLRIQRVIAECVSGFTVDHRIAVESYFKSEALPISETERDELLVSAEDGDLRIRFDGEGRITEMKNLLHPKKPKGGFFKRLFGKD